MKIHQISKNEVMHSLQNHTSKEVIYCVDCSTYDIEFNKVTEMRVDEFLYYLNRDSANFIMVSDIEIEEEMW